MQYTIHTVMLTGFISERHLYVEYVISEVYQVYSEAVTLF
jgi:hypothetical protein